MNANTPMNQSDNVPVLTKHAQTIRVGGFHTIVADSKELAQMMLRDCLGAKGARTELPKLVFSSNGQGVSLAGMKPDFMKTMAEADIVHADGMSVVWASRLLTSSPLPSRVATSDYFYDAAEVAQEHGLSFFIFGGSEAQNASVVDAIAQMYPDLKIAGRRNGYFQPEEEEDICRQIIESGADVLWVGLGKPLQEEWSVRNRDRLKGLAWIKTCGGLYAFLSGSSRRAPRWVQNIGFEWLWRLALNPRRLALRYAVTNPHSIYRLIRYTDWRRG